MSKFLRVRSIALPVMLLAGAGLMAGCGDDATSLTECEGQLGAKVEAFGDAVEVLTTVSGQMKGELGVACYKIAKDLGDTTVQDPGTGQELEDAQLTTLCNAAKARLDASLQAAGQVTIAIEGGQCRINAQAQVNCEADCSVNAECRGGDVSARCDPGELSVQCSGECQASATCQGSAQVAANCEGTCDATCTGTCSGTCTGTCEGTCAGDTDTGAGCKGTCNGTCTGSCSAKCEGTCKGNCTLAADANIECGANARCKGGCTGTATAPQCEVKLDPPECEVDADCSAACESKASLEASCEPIKVVVSVTGNASLKTTLEANLPAILKVAGKAELAGNAIVDVGSAGVRVAGEISGSAQCLASVGASFVAQLQASAAAAATVNVSFTASASVSGSATGGAG
ncbi:MAG TPA: hypothetical protein VK524_14555 [Polyangiaceae bacterium]|nr:hypothetical protein [Polyangiaceae bacterium]